MIGDSMVMKDLFNVLYRSAVSESTILITGESGTGKDLAAQFIHRNSPGNNKPFLTINCNAINDSLLESELFGHEKGAFTGACSKHIGKFEDLDKWTIFLDEIGDINPQMQAALLRVLQNGENSQSWWQ